MVARGETMAPKYYKEGKWLRCIYFLFRLDVFRSSCILGKQRNVVLPFTSASTVSYFVAEVCYWGRRERKMASFLPFLNKANSTPVAESSEIAKVQSNVRTKQCLTPVHKLCISFSFCPFQMLRGFF